jgi:IS5 family transposase
VFSYPRRYRGFAAELSAARNASTASRGDCEDIVPTKRGERGAGRKPQQRENFALYRRVLRQKLKDREKIYSLHEPHVYCVAKGKEHKKYEFGTKASIAITKTSGVIVAAVAHLTNQYDGHTLSELLGGVKFLL